MAITLRQVGVTLVLTVLAAILFAELHHVLDTRTRVAISGSDPDRLARLGRRLIVGCKDLDEIKELVEKRAIAGVFITSRNVRGRSVSEVAADVQKLQHIREVQGLPKLIVATDQEGGSVSRLSPPLALQPSLGSVIAPLKTDAERKRAVKSFAEMQARELKRLGVTMNFAPVVDLQPRSPVPNDNASLIYWRAIHSDPAIVAQVATWYCETLLEFEITCTPKHFPGLGRVTTDTHVEPGVVADDEAQLEISDWVPFRRILGQPGVATMIGHVRLDAIDSTTPASYSFAVVSTLLRSQWKYNGLILTDDLGMGAITRSKDGIGGAAVKALNAGVDLLLVANCRKHLDSVLSALIEADADGRISKVQEADSLKRLSKYTGWQTPIP